MKLQIKYIMLQVTFKMTTNKEDLIETDPQKICLKLIDEVEISPIYDSKKDITTFSFKFPTWLNKNYSKETVQKLIDLITPALVEEMNYATNKDCFQVIKENC